MKKKVLSVLLAGLVVLSAGNTGIAEELTGEMTGFEQTEESTDFDLEEILAISEEVGEFSEAEELTEAPDILTAEPEEQPDRTQKDELGDGSEELSFVGASSSKTEAFRVLRDYIYAQDEYYPEYDAYVIYRDSSPDPEFDSHHQEIWYDVEEELFEFYDIVEGDGCWIDRFEMYVPYGMPGPVNVKYNFFVDDEQIGEATAVITDPSAFEPEKLIFSIDGTFHNEFFEPDDCEDACVRAFEEWDKLVNKAGESMYSLGFKKLGKLSAPTITGFYNSVKGGDIRWNAVPNADGYYIYRNRKADGGNKLIATVGKSTTQYYDGAIRTGCWGRVYVYTIVAYRGNIKSTRSNAVTLQRLAPMKFTSCTSPAAGSVSLKWACTVSENKALGYEVQYATSKEDLFNRSGSFKKVSVNGRNSLSKTVSGLVKGVTYYFRIRCYVNYTHSVTGVTTKTWSQYSDVVSVKVAGTTTRYRALLIGVGDYPDDANDLGGPPNDVKAMSGTLKNYGYTVTEKYNIKSSQFSSAINTAFKGATANDVSLFFFSGHGDTETGGLITVDYSHMHPKNLAALLNKVPGKIVVILDSCGCGGCIYNPRTGEWEFSADKDPDLQDFNQRIVEAFAEADPGMSLPQEEAELLSGDPELPQVGFGEMRTSKYLVLTAATGKETSTDVYVDGVWGASGVRAVVAAAGCTFPAGSFRGSIPADANKDKKLSLKELYVYASAEVDGGGQHIDCYPRNSNAIVMVKK